MPLVIAESKFPLPRLLYREFHIWLLILASLDIVLTFAVLRLGGEETNVVARAAFAWGGLAGMVALKSAGVLTVLGICEYVGRERLDLGRRVMGCAIAANTAPVAMAGVILAIYAGTVLGAF
jgi:hypothetical protein